MDLDKRELTTVLAGLRYLQANRDDALEAMSDFDDASGTETQPYLLTEDEIDALCERINLGEDKSEKKIPFHVVFDIAGKPKGILSESQYLTARARWWNSSERIEVPESELETLNIDNIKKYLK